MEDITINLKHNYKVVILAGLDLELTKLQKNS